MSESEQAEATTAEEQQVDTDDGAEAEASAGTENTESAEAKSDTTIPKPRFDQVIGERNELRLEKEALEERLEALEQKAQSDTTTKSQPDSEGPPEHLSAREKVEWYVRQDSKKFLEEELGMDLKTVKTLLSTTKETSSDYATRRWKTVCDARGLDPADTSIQEFAYNYSKGRGKDADIDKIMDDAAKLFGGKSGNGKTTETSSANIEETGVTGTMTGDKVIFRDAKAATEAAGKGVQADYESLDQILERSAAERKKA